jgi:uncharacterized protein YdcH (DUF465 family)
MTTRIEVLKERHQHLDDIIDEMNDRTFLSPKERETLTILKVQRLRLKDKIHTLKSDSDEFSMLPPKFEMK